MARLFAYHAWRESLSDLNTAESATAALHDLTTTALGYGIA